MRLRTLLALCGLLLIVLPSVGCSAGEVSQDDIKKNAAEGAKLNAPQREKDAATSGNGG